MTHASANKPQVSANQSPPTIIVSGEGDHLTLTGALDLTTLTHAQNALKQWSNPDASHTLDMAGLDSLDTPGALFLCGLQGKGIQLTGIRTEHQALLDLICGLDLKPLPKIQPVPGWRMTIIQIGKNAHHARHEALDIITFIGRTEAVEAAKQVPGVKAVKTDKVKIESEG